jgi:hypothetical protein
MANLKWEISDRSPNIENRKWKIETPKAEIESCKWTIGNRQSTIHNGPSAIGIAEDGKPCRTLRYAAAVQWTLPLVQFFRLQIRLLFA